jgi:hypothetical protein
MARDYCSRTSRSGPVPGESDSAATSDIGIARTSVLVSAGKSEHSHHANDETRALSIHMILLAGYWARFTTTEPI